MASESIHGKLGRVRPPRVHITYKVQTGGAEVERELPFVVGVLGDFSGDPVKPLDPLAKRKFVTIDRDNINDVLARMTPGMAVQLKFRSLDDFEPGNVVQQVEPLRKLLETRNRLRDILTKVDRSTDLEAILEQVFQSTELQKKLAAEIAAKAPANPAPEEGK
jgi:type VI secretion system protein ImpB